MKNISVRFFFFLCSTLLLCTASTMLTMIRKSPVPKGQINKLDQEGFARLHNAILDGNSVRVLELFTEEVEKADPNVEEKHTLRTPLHLA